MSHVNKVTSDRNQRALLELVQKPGNDVCADCKARIPRWTSHNLGIFICLNCASIHRKIGTHITKVKSVTMDTWTKEQVEVMKQNGNLKSNAHYNPDEVLHPPPTNMVETDRDSELEKYIRAKYEFKRFINRFPNPPSQPAPSTPSSSSFPSAPRSKPVSGRSFSTVVPPSNPPRGDSLGYRPSPAMAVNPATQLPQMQPSRSVSQPLPSQSSSSSALVSSPSVPQQTSSNPVWDDLISLQSSATTSLPLQYRPNTQSSLPTQPFAGPSTNPYANQSNTSPFDQVQMSSPISALSPGGLTTGSMNTGIGMGGMGTGAPNPFQQQQRQQLSFNTTVPTAFSPTGLPNNPFAQPYLSPTTTSPFAGMSGQSLPQSSSFHSSVQPFSQTPAGQQFQAQLQSQSQQAQAQAAGLPFFQPQPQPPAQQQQQGSPFAQQPSPFGQQSSPFGQQHSPFGQQPSPPQQQQPQQILSPGNPFASWQQQQPGGYSNQQGGYQGQQWSGM